MKLAARSRRLAAAFGALAFVVAAGLPAAAQDIAESHLSAARSALQALKATEEFDVILPSAAQALKSELIQKNPDLSDEVTAIVDGEALKLASRRTDLEKEAALAYARAMSEADLNAIAQFYTSPAGLNLLKNGPIVTREVAKAAEIWQNGIARDLAEQVAKELQAKVGAPATAGQTTPAPAEGTSAN